MVRQESVGFRKMVRAPPGKSQALSHRAIGLLFRGGVAAGPVEVVAGSKINPKPQGQALFNYRICLF